MPADDAHAALVALHGIGPWTADIYLLACLGHADAWPAGDLALQEAARLAFGLPQAPDHEGDGPARRTLAALARGGGAAAVDLLSRGEEARRRADRSRPAKAAARRRRSEARMAAELDGPRLAPKSGPARQLVVFLHGYGADGNDLIEIGRAWQALLPQAAFVSPHAPRPCGQAPMGREWFPLTFRNPTERWDGVNAAAPVLEQLPRCRACAPQASAVRARAGRLFSQGTMMALHVGLRRAVAPAAIVGYSGMLVLEGRHRRRRLHAAGPRPPAGAAGAWRRATISFRCRRCFMRRRRWPRSKCRSSGTFRAGIGHGIDDEGLRHGGEFLARRRLPAPCALSPHDGANRLTLLHNPVTLPVDYGRRRAAARRRTGQP